MLLVNFVRQNADYVKERLSVRHFGQLHLVDELLSLDESRRKLQVERDELQSKVNAASKEIGNLMRTGDKAGAEKLKADVAAWKQQMEATADMELIEKQLHDILVQIPNLPSRLVPEGKTPEDNVVVREGGVRPAFGFAAKPHWELVADMNLIDFELGNKLTGSGFPVYKGKGARLQRAMIQYFLDYNTQAGYTEIQPPLMVNEASAYGTGQLPDKEAQMYHATVDNFYLIPTSEVPLTNIYRDEIVKEADLPLRMTAYTPCFRREAGSYGKDVRGLNRLHQFDKVEIVQLVHPEKSYEALDEMVAHVERLIQSLALPYRILRLCGGDMGFTSALTYDFEVFSAAQEKWLEVSSVSNFESYQTNRMKIRHKDAHGKTQLLHSLNGSSLALPRILAALLENNQDGKGGIRIPAALQGYFGAGRI
ncbi:MAG: serine--tRNA ligase [Flavihumibacter sp.]